MIAIYMWGERFLWAERVPPKFQPEVRIPLRKVFNTPYMLEPEIADMHGTNFICFVFKYADGGRGDYVVYELDGFDNLPSSPTKG